MASLNFSRGLRVFNAKFLMTAALIVSGSLAATAVTEFGRASVIDVSFRGGDALYAVIGAYLTLVMSGSRPATLMAGGMLASAISTALNDFGVVN